MILTWLISHFWGVCLGYVCSLAHDPSGPIRGRQQGWMEATIAAHLLAHRSSTAQRGTCWQELRKRVEKYGKKRGRRHLHHSCNCHLKTFTMVLRWSECSLAISHHVAPNLYKMRHSGPLLRLAGAGRVVPRTWFWKGEAKNWINSRSVGNQELHRERPQRVRGIEVNMPDASYSTVQLWNRNRPSWKLS